MIKSIVVLGGYGNFGRRIADALSREPNTRVLIAGRNERSAVDTAREIGGNTEPLAVDYLDRQFVATLKAVNAAVLVHTAGPFQGQDYQVANTCVSAGCHYVDIADARKYVASIGSLDSEAKANGVLIVSGASSLPALSSAVVDQYLPQFSRLDSIEHAISSGAKPPGVATMHGVLSYVGKPFNLWDQRRWRTAFGWQDMVSHRFPYPVSKRWLVACDVPDLELFPVRYPSVQRVVFRAGLGFATTTIATWFLSWLVRCGAMSSLARYANGLHKAATLIEPLGTRWSAMHVRMSGVSVDGDELRKDWYLLAGDNHGPNIPCFPAIALTRKLIRGELAIRGAIPCMGLLSVEEILGAIPNLNLRVVENG
jgi:hypothetical protein